MLSAEINALPDRVRRYIAALETECDPAGTIRDNFRLREENSGLRIECENLARQVYVPGLWRCPKCEFELCQATLYAATGAVGARDEPGDKCPNCNSPLWRVSERAARNDMVKRYEQELERNRLLDAVIEKQALPLMKIRCGEANPIQIARTAMDP